MDSVQVRYDKLNEIRLNNKPDSDYEFFWISTKTILKKYDKNDLIDKFSDILNTYQTDEKYDDIKKDITIFLDKHAKYYFTKIVESNIRKENINDLMHFHDKILYWNNFEKINFIDTIYFKLLYNFTGVINRKHMLDTDIFINLYNYLMSDELIHLKYVFNISLDNKLMRLSETISSHPDIQITYTKRIHHLASIEKRFPYMKKIDV